MSFDGPSEEKPTSSGEMNAEGDAAGTALTWEGGIGGEAEAAAASP